MVVSPLRAMSIKSALRIYLSVSYVMIDILVIGSLRSPPLSGCTIGHTCGVKVQRVQPLTLIVPPLAVARELDSQGAAGD